MLNTSYRCDRCKSLIDGVLMPESYRLNASNFKRYRLEIFDSGNMGPGRMAEEFVIGKECQVEFEAALNALIDPLKANQVAMKQEAL